MPHRSLAECVDDLAYSGQLVRIEEEVDPYLEVAEIHRRVNQAGGPAILFTRLKGCRFQAVSNLFGTLERARYLFRDSLDAVRKLIELKLDPSVLLSKPWRVLGAARGGMTMLPRYVRRGPVLEHSARISDLPRIQSWPNDGGAFITLPLVYTEDPRSPGWKRSNLGMYRIQISGGRYMPDAEIGMHYQIHRGIGVHHAAAKDRNERLPVSIFVGGPPAMTLAAVMPLPEGVPELSFAGALGRRRVRLSKFTSGKGSPSPIWVDADFCITGWIDPTRTLPEGPFGDHLGYYSLVHEFPVMTVDKVYHRRDAIWSFTVVGRPPQEDTVLGQLIHEITGPVIPNVLPGVKAVHAVDAAGVHPLLLAIGSERYTPYQPIERPQELLTQANAILGQGQLSLAKFVWIANHGDAPDLDIHNVEGFFVHILERVDWRRDLHFQTETTMDTLDYSGTRVNEGSKVIVAAVGRPIRSLRHAFSDQDGPAARFRPRVVFPGCIVLQADRYDASRVDLLTGQEESLRTIMQEIPPNSELGQYPLWVVVDDADFAAKSLANFLWVTFTRGNPASDIHGVGAFTQQKHWGCTGPLVIDARIKPHHAPPLEADAEVARRVERLAVSGGPLCGII